MTKRIWFLNAVAPLLALAGGLCSCLSAAENAARFATFERPSGEKYFALSLSPTEALPVAAGHDVLVLIDTSATQAGAYRSEAKALLKGLIDQLAPQDRIALTAIDTKAVPLTTGFVKADGPELKAALAALAQRAPLGATDMQAALTHAADRFAGKTTNAKAALYIGDGMNQLSHLDADEFSQLTERLNALRVPVSACALGVEKNVEFLAAVANQTGGNLLVTAPDDGRAEDKSRTLAGFVQSPVVWLENVKLPESFEESYPKKLPPLRADRDTILVGTLKKADVIQVTASFKVDGEDKFTAWTVQPERTNDDLSFLPKLIEVARRDAGVSLPTLGSAGLREAAAVLNRSADELTELAQRAFATGDREGARRAAEEALRRDPKHPKATALRDLTAKRTSTTAAIATQENAEIGDAPVGAPPAAAAASAPGIGAAGGEPGLTLVNQNTAGEGGLLERYEAESGRFLDKTEGLRKVRVQQIEKEVTEGIKDARQAIAERNSEGAVKSLKLMQDMVERAPDLDPETRSLLRDKLISALREAQRRSVVDRQNQADIESNQATAIERERLNREFSDRQSKLVQLMQRFESLMEERRFTDAQNDVVPQIALLATEEPIYQSALWWSDARQAYVNMEKLVDLRTRNYLASLYQVELSMVPFPDEPPIVYPPKEFWEDITIRRAKYRAVSLVKAGSAEERITKALGNVTKVEALETPFQELIQNIAAENKIPIVLDRRTLDEAGINVDDPQTITLEGITLRSALRIVLGNLALSYVIKDEVLQITTEEESKKQLVTKVYNVGDLVVPIPPPSGGFGGGAGGLGGGGQGGGGQGGGGGGFGGGGGGGFGGGGMGFDVEDELSLGTSKQPATEKTPVETKPIEEKPVRTANKLKAVKSAEQSWGEAWDVVFVAASDRLTAEKPDLKPSDFDADVRHTVRELMAAKDYEQSSALIQAALRNGLSQPWMYEALSIAMRASGAPADDVERALLSGVDMARGTDNVLLIAAYLSKSGFERSALKLYKQVSKIEPQRPEPFVQAMACAEYLQDHAAIRWSTRGVLSQAWPRELRQIEDKATNLARAEYARLTREKKTEEAAAFEKEIMAAVARDCFVVVTWTGDADLDLKVEEPSGSICSLDQPRTIGGGVLLGDSFAHGAEPPAEGFQEAYALPQGFNGEYKLIIKRLWGKVTAGKATVDIFIDYQTPKQVRFRKQVEIGGKDQIAVAFELDHGRRKEMLAEEQVRNVAQVQNAIGRGVLAQQLNQFGNSPAVGNYLNNMARARGIDPRTLLAGAGGGGAVGYRIVPQQINEGPQMMSNAVISADRRYVRISPQPQVQAVVRVDTFNVATGNVGNGQQGGQGGGGAGGGLAGGAGGLGGGGT